MYNITGDALLYGLLLVILFATCTNIQSMEIGQKNLSVPRELGDIKVVYKKQQFFVNNTPVKRCNVDERLGRLKGKQDFDCLFMDDWYISVRQIGPQKYKLDLKHSMMAEARLVGFLIIGGFAGSAAVHAAGHGPLYPVVALTGPALLFFALHVDRGRLNAYIEDYNLAGIAIGMGLGTVLRGFC